MRALPEDRAAADRMKGYLEAHFEYLQAPDGTETVIGGHRVAGRTREFGGAPAAGAPALHPSVYLREWLPNTLMGNWLGFSLCSDPNMGGGVAARGDPTDEVRFRGGSTAKISKSKNWYRFGGQGQHTFTGSAVFALAHRTKRDDLRRELQTIDVSKDAME